MTVANVKEWPRAAPELFNSGTNNFKGATEMLFNHFACLFGDHVKIMKQRCDKMVMRHEKQTPDFMLRLHHDIVKPIPRGIM